MLDNCYEIPKCNQRKRDRRSHMRLMLIGGYATGLRIDELLQVSRDVENRRCQANRRDQARDERFSK